jgi:hypothetical protein
MLTIVQSANLLLRFLVELGALAAVAIWAASLPLPAAARAGAAVATPLLLGTVWALFLSPGSSVPMPEALRTTLQLGVFVGAALALLSAGRPGAAAGFAAVAITNAALITAWN